MSRKVRIGELKTHLSEHLRYVRRGGTIIVLDREEAIARIDAHRTTAERLVISPPSGKIPLGQIRLPRPLKGRTDIVALLLEDRHSER